VGKFERCVSIRFSNHIETNGSWAQRRCKKQTGKVFDLSVLVQLREAFLGRVSVRSAGFQAQIAGMNVDQNDDSKLTNDGPQPLSARH
jgi:hypothetical protein